MKGEGGGSEAVISEQLPVGQRKEERRKKKPRWLNNEVKAAATTTVGSMKGTAVRARRSDLPRKSNLEKRMAAGSPRAKVRMVESAAW